MTTAERCVDTPPELEWMTVREAATRSRRHPKTVLAALHLYARGDRSGRALKGHQPDANCKWSIHRSDVDRWVRAEPPARVTRVA